MFAPVQQNQVHIRKLFHFLSHMSLQSDATVSIVGYKSNVLRIGIDCPDHADVRRDVVFVQKTAAYLVLQTVFIKSEDSGIQCARSFPSSGKSTTFLLVSAHITGTSPVTESFSDR